MNWEDKYKPSRKTDWEDIANAIHDMVSIEDVLRFYLPSLTIRRHRCACPIHNGKDMNFSFTRYGYKCFVCGASGDVVALVKEVCELSTRADAMKRLNDDLNLHLPIDSEQSISFAMASQKRREEAKKRQYMERLWKAKYNYLMRKYAHLDKVRLFSDPNSDEFAEAVKLIAFVEHEIDMHLRDEPR